MMPVFSLTGLRAGVAAAALATAAALAAPASALTLEEALAEAYTSNPTLQAQRAALRATDEGVPQAKAGWRPNVQIVGDVNGLRQRSSTRTARTESTRLTSGIELQVTQNVFDGGATGAAVEGAKAEVLAARADLIGAEQTILLQTASAYMDVLRDAAVVDLNTQNVVRLERQLEATRDRFDAGVATLTDVAQAESRIARARSNLSEAEGDLEVARAVFEEVVGVPPVDLSTPDLALDLPTDREEAKTLAAERNPDVVSAVYDRRVALHAIDEQFADLLPSVDLSATASRDLDKASKGSRVTDMTLSATVTVPIYQQGFETSQVRESKLSAAQALSLIEEARRGAIEQASSAWETYRAIIATIAAIREEVRAAEIALDGVQQEELVGQRTVLDVLDAEQELLDAKVSLVRAERDETVARFDLVAAVGGLTAPDLGIAVDAYDPMRHYRGVEGLWWGLGDPVAETEEDAAARQVQP
jgi:outer membrane protein